MLIEISDGSGTKNTRPARPLGRFLAVLVPPETRNSLFYKYPARPNPENKYPNTREYFSGSKTPKTIPKITKFKEFLHNSLNFVELFFCKLGSQC